MKLARTKKNVLLLTGIPVLLFGITACLSNTFDGPEKLGGVWVSASKLNQGHDTYMNYCMQCHGVNGDGRGPASPGMNPPPRNFKQGIVKFQSTNLGELPTDKDLAHTIRYGLRGTHMLPWDISDERLDAVVQYIKTFSPVWKKGLPGTPVETSPDPFGPAKSKEAVALGRKVYHGMAQCYTCHPSYATLSEIKDYSQEMTGNATESIRENPHLSVLQDSSYGHKFMPPDFTKNYIKSGDRISNIYERLGVGVNGTTMPSWKGGLSGTGDANESELRQWALAYYVRALVDLKYKPETRKKFFEELGAARSGNGPSPQLEGMVVDEQPNAEPDQRPLTASSSGRTGFIYIGTLVLALILGTIVQTKGWRKRE